MIDAVYMFTRGGVVLWSFCCANLQGAPVENLIKNVLLEERSGSSSATVAPYTLQWLFLNKIESVLVVAYRGIAQLTFIGALLEQTAAAFLHHMHNQLPLDYVKSNSAADFNPIFVKLFSEVYSHRKVPAAPAATAACMRNKLPTAAGGALKRKQKKSSAAPSGGDDDEEGDETGGNAEKGGTNRNKTGKVRRPYFDIATRITKKDMNALDCSKKSSEEDTAKAAILERTTYGADEILEDSSSSEEEESEGSNESSGANRSSLFFGRSSENGTYSPLWLRRLASKVQDFTGKKMLTEEDIEQTLPALRTFLAEKNVAEEVIDLLLQSVQSRLTGTRTASFTSVNQTVRAAVREAVVRILTPKKSVDVLRLALEAKAEGRVFSIVFLGVNGVGKSTNLAKVAYYLKHKGKLDVLIAACDTFRAGAVEQLRTHARCLEVPLFEKGYGKDAAAIAKEALALAKQDGRDVVLIDTAGRMQDNEPLMRTLAKLVAINNPDLILFVGEALVGNDAVDQLKKFNQTLIDLTAGLVPGRSPRTVDGILLTKFDTVDDKVGAALSMVYITGQPVVFVGTGQKYLNLKKLNPKTVVNALLD